MQEAGHLRPAACKAGCRFAGVGCDYEVPATYKVGCTCIAGLRVLVVGAGCRSFLQGRVQVAGAVSEAPARKNAGAIPLCGCISLDRSVNRLLRLTKGCNLQPATCNQHLHYRSGERWLVVKLVGSMYICM